MAYSFRTSTKLRRLANLLDQSPVRNEPEPATIVPEGKIVTLADDTETITLHANEYLSDLEEKLNNTPTGLSGVAKLEAPAVMQNVEYIEAMHEVPTVDGPSAGALMTLLVVGGLQNLELRKDMTMTGTMIRMGMWVK